MGEMLSNLDSKQGSMMAHPYFVRDTLQAMRLAFCEEHSGNLNSAELAVQRGFSNIAVFMRQIYVCVAVLQSRSWCMYVCMYVRVLQSRSCRRRHRAGDAAAGSATQPGNQHRLRRRSHRASRDLFVSPIVFGNVFTVVVDVFACDVLHVRDVFTCVYSCSCYLPYVEVKEDV